MLLYILKVGREARFIGENLLVHEIGEKGQRGRTKT